ncbi:MAG: hypothetical protein J6T72_02005 [Alphaproteobacteria bacterium]|nr:hypothetical protein [Alphaproteobacteria bacterium]
MKKIKTIGTLYMIMCIATVMLAGFFQACNKGESRYVGHTKAVPSGTDTVVIQGDHGFAWFIRVTANLGHFHAEHEDGTVVDHMVPLPSSTEIFPEDTTLGTLPVNHVNFTSDGVDSLDEYVFNEIFHLRQYVAKYNDTYSYTIENGMDNFHFTLKHTETTGYAFLWGMTVPVPPINASLSYKDFSTAEAGSDGTWDYTRITSRYDLTRGDATSLVEGNKTLKREKGTHEFTGKDLVSAIWTPVSYNSFGFVTRARVDVKIASHYNGLPDQIDEESITRNCPVYIPGDSSMYASSFDFTHSTPVTSDVYTTGSTTEGHFQVTDKAITYGVGTSIFTRTSSFGWFELVWTDGTYTFQIQTPSYTNFHESYNVEDLSAQNGYDRKRVVNTISASINGVSGTAPIRTTVLVESQVVPPVDPTLDHYEVVSSGLTYVNENTNNSWLKLRPVYSDGSTGTPFNKDINLQNTVTCPAEGPFITESFDNVGVVGQVTMGPEEFVTEYTDGEFLKRKYRQTASINCAVFTLTWVLTYEKAIYNPLNYDMPYSTYSCYVSSGSYTDDLGEITSQNTTYLRKIWTQYMTTSFNQHNHQYAGTAEVRALNSIPRITPEWLGNPLEACYTRVQMSVGAQFMDMIVFKYEHGVVMAPNGIPDLNLIYAFTAADAAAHGVDQVYAPGAWYSGVYFSGKWWPAAITPNSGYTAWTYSYDGTPAHSHSVQRANALILNIGYDYHPIPSHQYYSISNGVITICYNANNQGEEVTAQCQLH